MTTLRLNVLAALLLAVAGGASAATYTNVPSGANTGLPFAYFGNAGNPSGDSPAVGEVFSLSAAEVLSSFSFYAIGNVTQSIVLNVAQWNPDTNAKNQAFNFIGTPLLTTATALETYDAAGGFTTLAFDNLSLSLDAGTKYVAYLTSSDPAVTGIQLSRTQTAVDATGFGIGQANLSTVPGNGWQLPFNGSGFLSLQYTAVTTPVPEPESLALLMAGLGVVGAVAKRRKAARA
ncbi:PEP-CTERM sorting domain-containing protein [Piscinibacter gummiphilus]|uniref:PEP-CTERM domain protein n=1 Tax=Piscinibacter gummiphilus TaxID=946333 RepID=A0A1W6L7D0_9BURK|nr:PEP-CTERM sorting domain-containing protein [Piscinibacter gummiphilus]ARN20132.1 PEP-CTERM domain protein [Piscinibacter gummiphilus]ATU64804.1 PEP-CTERM sorting domain-containing protein [Piscinibacter gummiphilus]GLS96961.1 hypothetical protein GCM10007918_42530 [Piscinibacter gummiphilus]